LSHGLLPSTRYLLSGGFRGLGISWAGLDPARCRQPRRSGCHGTTVSSRSLWATGSVKANSRASRGDPEGSKPPVKHQGVG
jgi:hypothetical protein